MSNEATRRLMSGHHPGAPRYTPEQEVDIRIAKARHTHIENTKNMMACNSGYHPDWRRIGTDDVYAITGWHLMGEGDDEQVYVRFKRIGGTGFTVASGEDKIEFAHPVAGIRERFEPVYKAEVYVRVPEEEQ